MTCCCDDWDVYDGWAQCEEHPDGEDATYTITEEP